MAEPSPLSWLRQTLAEQLEATFTGMAGSPAEAAWRVELPASTQPGALWWKQPVSLGPDAAVWIGADRENWLNLGSRMLTAIGLAPNEQDSRSTYREAISQALAGFVRLVGQRLSREVLCAEGQEQTSAPAGLEAALLQVSIGGDLKVPVVIAFSTELVRALGGDTVPSAPATVSAGSSSRTFDLLMDVELPVSISFGTATLPLKDVLRLSTGSIVELNRTITEPVEIIVNNCVIARGEVVVIEGNYGVRIQEIVSRQDRLRTVN